MPYAFACPRDHPAPGWRPDGRGLKTVLSWDKSVRVTGA
jgi:hypothetical protein